MDFRFQRQLRLAGSVAMIVGAYVHNFNLALIGFTIVSLGYAISINKLERFIEETNKDEKED